MNTEGRQAKKINKERKQEMQTEKEKEGKGRQKRRKEGKKKEKKKKKRKTERKKKRRKKGRKKRVTVLCANGQRARRPCVGMIPPPSVNRPEDHFTSKCYKTSKEVFHNLSVSV